MLFIEVSRKETKNGKIIENTGGKTQWLLKKV